MELVNYHAVNYHKLPYHVTIHVTINHHTFACACLLQLEREVAARALQAGDSLAAMEAYAKLAAKKDKLSTVRCSCCTSCAVLV